MEASIKNKIIKTNREELNKMTKKELVSFYKEAYNTNEVRASLTKTRLIEDIMECRKYIMRNEAIKRLVV